MTAPRMDWDPASTSIFNAVTAVLMQRGRFSRLSDRVAVTNAVLAALDLPGRDAELVESIAAGFDSLAAAAETFDRTGRDVDVVLAWQSAARYVRTHTPPATAVAAAVSSPTGTPGAPDPRDAVVDRAVEWRHRYSTPDIHLNVACMALADAVDALPATSPTGDPTDGLA